MAESAAWDREATRLGGTALSVPESNKHSVHVIAKRDIFMPFTFATKTLSKLLGDDISQKMGWHRYSVELPIAKLQIATIRALPNSPFGTESRPGYLRGIDFFDEDTLPLTVARYMRKYRRCHGD